MTWTLGYLLAGFVAHWIDVQIYRAPSHESWRWELAAVLLWPITILAVLIFKSPVATGKASAVHDDR